jgi:kinesin family protein 1
LDSDKPAAIRLSGENILEKHCYIDNEDGVVTLQAPAASLTVSSSFTLLPDIHLLQFLNGKRVAPDVPHKLKSGFRIILGMPPLPLITAFPDFPPGEHHVFRFNHPEEVRKQRDRQRHLSIGVNGDLETEPSGQASPATRPDSPASSAADADWNFAKREAALRLAGLNPDSMPDDELDTLYETITKVKTLRGRRFESGSRPDSSLSISQMDDMWSEMGRPIHSSEVLTDDTSMDRQNGDEPVSEALASAQIREMQGQLEAQRVEFENRLQEIGEGPGSQAEDLKVEKEHMEKQLVVVQAQMKRLLEMRGRGKIDEDFVPFEPVLYSARHLRLIRKVLDKWRAHRAFSMAETVLSSAVTVKEANIIRLVSRKRAFYG